MLTDGFLAPYHHFLATLDMKSILAFLLLTSPVLAAEIRVYRDIPYVEPQEERRTLDVFAPLEGKDHPVVVWIHGGGWREGDKTLIQRKPYLFPERGFVFIPINYRFLPNVTVKEMTGDVARAIHWVHDHVRNYGGSHKKLFVAGHSAGAHLAALVCTDGRYLQAEGLSLADIKGCIPLDASVYDIPKRLQDGGEVPRQSFEEIFGKTEESQRELSPVLHVRRNKNVPPFLFLYVASRTDTKEQAEWFAKALKEIHVSSTVVAAEGKTHSSINKDLGRPGDKPTEAIFQFLEMELKNLP